MAELSAADSVQAVASEQEVLLATKLHVPGSRPGLVPRPRLTGRLTEGLGQGLVLVCAPAGYGKTVLLAQWARQGGRPIGWLSLDAADNDPARFWRHAVAALDQACPGIGERVDPLLGPPTPPSFEPLVTALINELATAPDDDDVLLVLDDYHVIDSRPVHEQVSFLLEHRPPGLDVVLASRTDPSLALARLRARGQLTELRAADLRFTADEAGGLLANVAAEPGVVLPEEAVAALAERTEGWAAGLQLAALSLRGHEDILGFVAAFTGSHRYVLDFLAEEVLERQSEQVRTFLLETSVLERLSGELCDAVTGRPGSQTLLEQVERAGLFLVALDEVRGWWRYHHLFADLLRVRLQAEQPSRVRVLHRAAGIWYEEHGLADDAIRHAMAAGEITWAARLIEQNFDAAHNVRGEAVTVQRWLTSLPDDLVRSRPRLLLAQAIATALLGRLEAAEELANAAEAAVAGAADEPFEPTGGRAGSLLVNVPAAITLVYGYLAQARGDADSAAEFAARAMAESREGEWILQSVAHGELAVAAWLDGRLSEAEHALERGIAGRRAAGLLTWSAWESYELCQVQQAQGRLDAAARTCERALDATARAGRAPLPAAGAAYVGLAEVAYQRNELDRALEHVTQGLALSRGFVYSQPLAAGLATLAWIRQATGNPVGALAAMDEAVLAAPGPPGLLNPVPAQRARLLLIQGGLSGAARWARETGLGVGDEPDHAREPGLLVLARVLLAEGRPARALALLDRLHAAATAQEHTRSLIEIGILRALAGSGDEASAVTTLAEALVLACPQGYVRVFADEGPPMAALLGRLVAAQRAEDAAARRVPLGCLARLQRAFDATGAPPDPGPGATSAVPGIVEPLTGRELEVLGMLAAGLPNKTIARDLVVSLDTVKKHVGHVLGKLGAANRTEAVARAQQLGLIP
jgi:LuxR family maltose regulon positive regulatory protein